MKKKVFVLNQTENQRQFDLILNRKLHAVTNSIKKKVFVLNQTKIKDVLI